MKPLRAIFFDFGGTLATVKPSVEGFLQLHLHKAGRSLPFERIRDIVLRRHSTAGVAPAPYSDSACLMGFWLETYEELLRAGGASTREAAHHAISIWNAHHQADAYVTFEDTFPALERLRGKAPHVCVLSNFDASLRDKLDYMGLAGYFSEVFCSVEVGLSKPDPRFLEHACARLGVSPHESVLIGDDWSADAAPCEKLGVEYRIVDRSRRHATHARAVASLTEAVSTLDNDLSPALVRLR